MEIKLLLTSLPQSPEVMRAPSQLYTDNWWVNSLVSRASAWSISSIVGPYLWDKLSHSVASKIKRNFGGITVGISGNISIVKGEYSLQYIPLEKVQFFVSIENKEHFEESNRAPQPLPGVLLNGTLWEGLTNLYLLLWSTVTNIYHG